MTNKEDVAMASPSPCWLCGYKHDSASEAEGEDKVRPTPGDVSICINCGEWNAFDDGLRLRRPNKEEYDYIGKSDLCKRVYLGWLRMRKKVVKHDG